MSKKKSYMNISNILGEGFLDSVKSFIKKRKLMNVIKNDKNIAKSLDAINADFKDLVDKLNAIDKKSGKTGNTVKVPKRMTVKDFI